MVLYCAQSGLLLRGLVPRLRGLPYAGGAADRLFSTFRRAEAAFARPPPGGAATSRARPASGWLLSAGGWRDPRSPMSRLLRSVTGVFRLDVPPDIDAGMLGEIDKAFKVIHQELFPEFTVTAEGAEVRLEKDYENESILIVFNSNHEIVKESGENPCRRKPFTIEITKGNERLCFHIELIEDVKQMKKLFDLYLEELYIAPAASKGNEEVPSWTYETSQKRDCLSSDDSLYVKYLAQRGLDKEFFSKLRKYIALHNFHMSTILFSKIKYFKAK